MKGEREEGHPETRESSSLVSQGHFKSELIWARTQPPTENLCFLYNLLFCTIFGTLSILRGTFDG